MVGGKPQLYGQRISRMENVGDEQGNGNPDLTPGSGNYDWQTNSGNFDVRNFGNNCMRAVNIGSSYRYWTMNTTVDISSYDFATINIGNIWEGGNLDNDDRILGEYSLDGGSWTEFFYFQNDFSDYPGISRSVILNGNNVRVRIGVRSDDNNDYLYFDNISITGTSCPSGPISLPWTEGFEDVGPTTTFTSDEPLINGTCVWFMIKLQMEGYSLTLMPTQGLRVQH